MKPKVFESPIPVYSKGVIGRKIIVLHDNEKTSITSKVKVRHARPKLIEHTCKDESNCNLCINYLRYLGVYRNE